MSADFATFVVDLSHGEVNSALSDKLEKLIAAVHDTGKPGRLTVKVTIKKEGTMAVAYCEATEKLPEADLPGTMFFFDKSGKSLQREDPRQLSLKEVVTPSQPLRSVNGDDD